MIGIIFGAVGGIAAALVIVEAIFKPIRKVIDHRRIRKYNKDVCGPVISMRNEFLEENYGADVKDLKPFKIEKTNGATSSVEDFVEFTLFRFHSNTYYKNTDKNLNLTAFNLIIDWGVKRTIKELFTHKGLPEEDADEISKAETEVFLESKIKGRLIPKDYIIRTLKTKLYQDTPTSPVRNFIRKNSGDVRSFVRENFKSVNLVDKYKVFLGSNKDYKKATKDDVDVIISGLQFRKNIKDDPGVDLRGIKPTSFNRVTKENLKDLKKAFLKSRKDFIKKINSISNRSEQIYALILEYPGRYEVQMSTEFRVPQPTISIYCDQMEKDGFVIKDTYSTPGNYVYLYPRFTFAEMKLGASFLLNYEIVITGKLMKKRMGKYFLEGYKELELNLESIKFNLSNFLGCKLLLRGTLASDFSFSVILPFGIMEGKTKQKSLGSYVDT